jgi:phosphoglycolate phosphatase-like HAD superfamily hydrolase
LKSNIVFDLDGTLITCENKQKYVLFSILTTFGYENVNLLNDWWILKRNGFNTEKALDKIGIPEANLISNEWIKEIESSKWVSLDTTYSDSFSMLEFLTNRKQYNLFLLTARRSKFLLFQTLQRLCIDHHFSDIIVVSPKNVVFEKSDFLDKLKPDLFIGDTELDYKASLSSKTRFVALSRGQRSYNYLLNIGVSRIEKNLSFLCDL